MRKAGDFVAGSWRSHHQLPRNRPTTGVQRQRLFWREAPLRSETLLQIGSAKAPERRIPCRALTLHHVGAARDEPAFYHPLEKAAGDPRYLALYRTACDTFDAVRAR